MHLLAHSGIDASLCKTRFWVQGILTAAVEEGETFSFCMCNPPFFHSLQEAGRNPSTAYGGTAHYPASTGGAIICDSSSLLTLTCQPTLLA